MSEKSKTKIVCPKCESTKILTLNVDTYECHDCGCIFLLQEGKKYAQILN